MKVEPDAEMQMWTHSAVAKILRDETSVGMSPPHVFGHGSNRPHAVSSDGSARFSFTAVL